MQKLTAVACFSLIFAGCGGSGGGSDEVASTSVNAGADLTVIEKNEFTLKALGSPEGGTFNWQVQSGPSIEGFPQSGAEVTATAPDVKGDSALVFKVDYITSSGGLVSDTVTVNVTSNNLLPIATIKQTAPETLPAKFQDTITLSAADSTDPDTNGEIVAYQWQQISGPSNISPARTDLVTLSFTHPLLAQSQAALWRLTVTDDEGGQASTEFSVPLIQNPDVVLANAGVDQQVLEFDTVSIDASQSITVDGGFSCQWSQTNSGEVVSLANANACNTTFIAPDKDKLNFVNLKVTVTDANNRTGTDEVRIDIFPRPLGLINDTGVVTCYDEATSIACNNATFPGQDADQGRDSVAQFVAKAGTGREAFDFTKLDQFADELPDDATNFACVRDNVTGLIWEIKEPSAGTLPSTSTRNAQNHYTWYLENDQGAITGSHQGAANSTCPQDTNCGTSALVAEVNNPPSGIASYCGGNNWRLPTYSELMGLLDLGRDGTSRLDPEFFPNLPNESLQGHLYYWTQQTSVDGSDGSLRRAFVIDMRTGNDVALDKTSTAYVRLVRTP